MTSVGDSADAGASGSQAATPARRSRGQERARLLTRPAVVFIVLSCLFGLPAVFLIPPFRGADEPAHFLRAYGLMRGEIVPTRTDDHGRKGIRLPADVNYGFAFFEAKRYEFGQPGFGYRDVFAQYRAAPPGDANRPPVFVLYAGSEGYSPVAYVPYIVAAAAARALRLDFVPMLWLMRLAGFVVVTAITAWAIAAVPRLGWTFAFIAMLPIATFERAIVSADGAALGLALMVTALCLRAASGQGHPYGRATWMTLCVLTKPSQVAFVLMEAMVTPFRELRHRWRMVLVIVAPGIVLTLLWLVAASADIAAWRMIEGTGASPEQFDIGWKLKFLLGHPLQFLGAALGTLAQGDQIWREMIGELGWRDTHLPTVLYMILTVAFVALCCVRLDLDRWTRRRVGVVSAATVLAYCAAILMIFYLAWTPIDAPFIHGVQGRYFMIALAPAAAAVAALVNRAPAETTTALIASAGAALSGIAMLDAIVRSQW